MCEPLAFDANTHVDGSKYDAKDGGDNVTMMMMMVFFGTPS